jgi:hypothetical protein
VILVGAVWLALGAGDWFMRFHWYGWHQTFIWRPFKAAQGPRPPLQVIELPPSRGGDLTHLVGIPRAEAEFADERGPAIERSDEFGYRNAPPTTNTWYPVIVSGASYMDAGHPMTNMFAARLADNLGVPVYNHAYPGRGPFFGLNRLLEDARFNERPPKVLVWGIVEREVGGDAFDGMAYQLRNLGRYSDEGGAKPYFDWTAFQPRRLKKSLPNTSALAQLSAKIWNQVRYATLGWLTPDVAVSDGTVEGRRFLFYTPAVTALKWTPKERRAEAVIAAIEELDLYLKRRGVALLIVLVPDKEQVYRELLPSRLNNPSSPIPPSCLLDLEAGLAAKGIRVVNMLEPFEARAAAGAMLYLRDDTHWNAEAIAMAADAAATAARELLNQP